MRRKGIGALVGAVVVLAIATNAVGRGGARASADEGPPKPSAQDLAFAAVSDDDENRWALSATAEGRRETWIGVGEGLRSVEVSEP